MLCFWWSGAGEIHYDYFKLGSSITADVYWDSVDKTLEMLTKKA